MALHQIYKRIITSLLFLILTSAGYAQSLFDASVLDQAFEGKDFILEMYDERWDHMSSGTAIYKYSKNHLEDARQLLLRIRGAYGGHISWLTDSLALVEVGAPYIVPLYSDFNVPIETRIVDISTEASQSMGIVKDSVYNVELFGNIGSVNSGVIEVVIFNDSIKDEYDFFLIIDVKDLDVAFLEKNLVLINVEWRSAEKHDSIFVYWTDFLFNRRAHISMTRPPTGWNKPKIEVKSEEP